MGKRKEGKVHIGLYVDKKVQDKLDDLVRVWWFASRTEVILRLLKYGVSEMDQLTRQQEHDARRPA